MKNYDFETMNYLVYYDTGYKTACKKFYTIEEAINFAKSLNKNEFITITQQRKVIIDI